MSKRWKILIGIALCLLAGIGAFWFFMPSSTIEEPSYQGKKLSEWIPGDDSYGIGESTYTVAQSNAIAYFGTNAIPCLLEWIRYEPSYWISHVPFGANINQWVIPHFLLEQMYQSKFNSLRSLDGFHLLGTNGAPAIPDLVRIMRNKNKPKASRNATFALAYCGKDAIPPLIEELANSDPRLRRATITALLQQSYLGAGTNLKPAIPLLIRYTQDPNEYVANRAESTLGRIGL